MWKFKSWKGRDKWLFLLTVGAILCILAIPVGGGNLGGASAAGSGRAGGRAAEGDKAAVGGAEAGAGVGGGDKGAGGVYGAADAGTEVWDGEKAGAGAVPSAAKPASAYEQMLEQRVKDILKNVDGVGEVEVMIVLKSSAEKVIHVDGSNTRSVTDETDSSGGARKIESEEQESSTVLTTAGGDNGPIIEKELYPEISGIVISAAGGGSPVVQEEISSAMQALFGLPAHKIKVLKRVG